MTTIQSPMEVNILVAKLDLLGQALCKYDQSMNSSPILGAAVSVTRDMLKKQHQPQETRRLAIENLKILNENFVAMTAIITLFRQLRDQIATANNIVEQDLSRSPALAAELMSEDLMRDDEAESANQACPEGHEWCGGGPDCGHQAGGDEGEA